MVRAFAGTRLAAALAAAVTLACSRPAAAPAPSTPPTKAVSLAILEDYDKGQDLAGIARDFGLFRELGITTWRGSFGWDDYEPEPGRYDFEWLQRFAVLARDSGITLRPYVAYTPEWAAAGGSDDAAWNDPPRHLERWRRFVDTLVATLGSHPNVASWEIYNEENVPLWWDGTLAEYAGVLTTGAASIRDRDAGAAVLIGGTVWPDTEWLEGICETHGAAGAFDIAPFHAYPETWPDTLPLERYLDESFRGSYLAAVDSSCGGKPVWINEAGFATTPGRSELEQARWWARAFAVFFAAPRVEHIGVYEIRDLRPDSDVIGDAPNYYLGLLRADGTPKQAFRTVQLMARLFRADSLAVADDRLGVTGADTAALVRHLFVMPDGRQLAFAWDSSAVPQARTIELTVPHAAGGAQSYALDGSATPVPLQPGGRSVSVMLPPGGIGIVEFTPSATTPATEARLRS